MPEISRFLGIVIAMYYKEHGPPHFHAKYGGDRAAFSIHDLRLIEGKLPPRVLSLVASSSNSGPAFPEILDPMSDEERGERPLSPGPSREGSPSMDVLSPCGEAFAFVGR
ncbi:MAG: DUF4160 domain-containing protein [Planctomycetes bacterium]|nr:DUF4160 domain-containing protein [Planctomycetota bacterium]